MSGLVLAHVLPLINVLQARQSDSCMKHQDSLELVFTDLKSAPEIRVKKLCILQQWFHFPAVCIPEHQEVYIPYSASATTAPMLSEKINSHCQFLNISRLTNMKWAPHLRRHDVDRSELRCVVFVDTFIRNSRHVSKEKNGFNHTLD